MLFSDHDDSYIILKFNYKSINVYLVISCAFKHSHLIFIDQPVIVELSGITRRRNQIKKRQIRPAELFQRWAGGRTWSFYPECNPHSNASPLLLNQQEGLISSLSIIWYLLLSFHAIRSVQCLLRFGTFNLTGCQLTHKIDCRVLMFSLISSYSKWIFGSVPLAES